MYPLRKFKLSRRTMLRGMLGGATVAVALPPLEAMLDANGEAYADGTEMAKQFMTFFFGNGVLLDRWEPAQVGEGWQLSPTLMPLAAVKDYINICTGYSNRCDPRITHHEGITALTGYNFVPRNDLPGFASDPGGPSIDQVIADSIASRVVTPVRSIQVGISKGFSPADNGVNKDTISNRGQPGNLTALPPEPNPQAVWQTLFGEFVPKPDDRALRLSILDLIKDDLARLRGKLGTLDNQRIDAHLSALGELETKISTLPPACEIPGMPTETNSEPVNNELITTITGVMAELVAIAFECDITRVASCMMLPLAGEATFGEIGAPNTHHILSHNAEFSNNALEAYHDGQIFIMEKLAQILEVFQSHQDMHGKSLLDTAIVYVTSDCSVGWSHSIRRHPVLLAGTGGGYLKYPGIHSQAVANNPSNPHGNSIPTSGNVSDILLALWQNYDPAVTSIGNPNQSPYSDTPLTDILA